MYVGSGVAAVALSSPFIFRAAAEPSPTDPVSLITNLGPIGLIVALFITGTVRTKGEVERVVADNARKDTVIAAKDEIIRQKDEQIARILTETLGKFFPALQQSANALERVASERRAPP
jgi:hypothetical protein